MPVKPDSGYERQAQVYDLIYTRGRGKKYDEEALSLHEIIQMDLRSGGLSLLDVACGTGLHAQYLSEWYNVTGLDISPAQLAIARRRLPGLELHEGDMRDFDLGPQFDVVTCLFSAIGHMLTIDDLHRAVGNMARHLVAGGLLLIEPWIHPDQFRPGMISTDVVRSAEMDVTRMVATELRGGYLSHLDMHHLVGTPQDGVRHFREVMDVAMYTKDEYNTALRAAGLHVGHDEFGLSGRGLFIARKPLPGLPRL